MTDFGPLLTLAIVLTAGLVGGEIAAWLRLPRVTGWILTGVGLRAAAFEVLDPAHLGQFRPFSEFVLGYIAFTVGSHLHVRSLINAHLRLFFLVLTEAVITPVVVIAFMCGIGGMSLDYGYLFAAVAIAGAPGTTVLVVREARARGIFVKTLIAAVALIDMVAVCGYVVLQQELHVDAGLSVDFLVDAVTVLSRTLAMAGGVALGCAILVIVLTRAIVGPQHLGASLVAAILLGWGVARWLGVSSILSVTLLGVALANIIPDKERAGEAYLTTFSSVLFTAFYVLAGLRLDFSSVLPVAGLIALFFGGRLVGKWLSSFVAMSLARAPKNVRFFLGPALLPHGGVAVGLLIIIQNDPRLAEFSDTVLAVGLAALAINQLVGPSAARWALRRVGETGLDRPRLLDFIREQDIVVGLTAKTRADAVRSLTDHLYKTHYVAADKARFTDDVVEHSDDRSSYLGGGLMVAHAEVPKGAEVTGVMGLSSEGFAWETPDNRRVHAIVVLATPDSQSGRHLEVLAAFVNAITSDRNIREQLYHVDTAAHAYDALHARDAEDFNYFIEDALDTDAVTPEERQADARRTLAQSSAGQISTPPRDRGDERRDDH